MIRILRLAMAVNRHAKLKFALLTVLIGMGTLVFLGVSELSRASTDNLDEAIESDLGAAGTYKIRPNTELGLSLADTLTVVREQVGAQAARPLQVILQFDDIRPVCPPYREIQGVSVAVQLDAFGSPLPYDDTRGTGIDADLCLGGLVVPRTAMREVTAAEKATVNASLIVDPLYTDSLRLATARPPTVTVLLVTDRSTDLTDALKATLTRALTDQALRATVDPRDAVQVNRGDTGGSVRAASDGIKLVYRLIGWGVLLVGGLGILVTELIVLRDRTWYFGLARAVGGRRRDVAALVLADIVLVLVAGLAATAVIAAALNPWVRAFGEQSFDTSMSLLRWQFAPELLLGAAVMLLLGGAYPAWRATRLDPLDVLERR